MGTAEVVAELLRQGLLGTLLLGSIFVLQRVYAALERERIAHLKTAQELHAQRAKEVSDVQTARLEDHKEHQRVTLELTRGTVTALTNTANGQTAVKESVQEIRAAMVDYSETVRELLEEQRRQQQPSRR